MDLDVAPFSDIPVSGQLICPKKKKNKNKKEEEAIKLISVDD